MFDHIYKQLSLTLINQKNTGKNLKVYTKKTEFPFLTQKFIYAIW